MKLCPICAAVFSPGRMVLIVVVLMNAVAVNEYILAM